MERCRRRATYRIANLRGLMAKAGNRKKQIRKQTAAPRLHAAKMSIRSHRLTRVGRVLLVLKLISCFPLSGHVHVSTRKIMDPPGAGTASVVTWIRTGRREQTG